MDDKRQKTQLGLALANESKGEAPKRIGGGTETSTATEGDLIPDTGGLRKVRFADPRRGKGKRGGLRVIYY